MPSGVEVDGPASTEWSPRGRAPRISAAERGPGRGSTTERSHETPPSLNGVPIASQIRATASAPTTSPPPPIPRTSALRAFWTIE